MMLDQNKSQIQPVLNTAEMAFTIYSSLSWNSPSPRPQQNNNNNSLVIFFP